MDEYTGRLVLQHDLASYKVSVQNHKDEVVTWKANMYRTRSIKCLT